MYVSHVLDRKLRTADVTVTKIAGYVHVDLHSHESVIFRIFGIHIFQVMASLGNLV